MSESHQYHVRVTKDHLVFSAAHFVTIGDFCERLHGHNWRVCAEATGPLDENSFVIDFIALRDDLQALVAELDHRMLLPTRHPAIQLETSEREVEVRFADRRWVFPREECLLLPLAQTTAELLARWFGERLLERFRQRGVAIPQTLVVEVEENFGQWAGCQLTH
ncbi:MAG: 6-pyruvoyl trahydropterin synthase family protein [Planctomycetaceae bacterium]